MFDHYIDFRRRFAVSREMAVNTLEWVEPLARRALGAHAHRDQIGLSDQLELIPVLSSSADNGGWGELMPVWFKPYERPLPIFILDNWAMTALTWQYWLGDLGAALNVQNLLKIFVGSSVLIPFLPATQRGGHFLRHGALTVLLGVLWLTPADRDAFVAGLEAGGRRFADEYHLRDRADIGQFVGQLEFEAFFIAEGNKVGGEEKIKTFLADENRFATYAALFGGLCFSVAALYNAYGLHWEQWAFQAVNVHYRYAAFGLEPWAKWLGIKYVEPEEERS
ncbi:MAG: hypothetical protein HY023_13895 [Chloroflexi bacterium]|nr:hypothetical protein [Chloroflexota bacterium]